MERFLPTRRRIDREINKLKFAYKGEVMMGLTASYGTVSSDDTDLMLIFDNIDADATIATVKPFVGYFYRDNNCIGIRFGYSHMGGTLDNTYFDAGEGNDLSGQLPYVDLSSDEYSSAFSTVLMRGSTPKDASDSSPSSSWRSRRDIRASHTTRIITKEAHPTAPTTTKRR